MTDLLISMPDAAHHCLLQRARLPAGGRASCLVIGRLATHGAAHRHRVGPGALGARRARRGSLRWEAKVVGSRGVGKGGERERHRR